MIVNMDIELYEIRRIYSALKQKLKQEIILRDLLWKIIDDEETTSLEKEIINKHFGYMLDADEAEAQYMSYAYDVEETAMLMEKFDPDLISYSF
jgi:uncharacterized protein YfbU (UPF0304 family)